MIKLGSRVRDRITGLEGVAVARCEWLFGCVRVTIQPQDLHEGKPIEMQTFDELSLEMIEEAAVPAKQEKPPAGGPQNDSAALRR